MRPRPDSFADTPMGPDQALETRLAMWIRSTAVPFLALFAVLSVPAAAQARARIVDVGPRERVQKAQSEVDYRSVLERLRQGRSALRELGREREADRLSEVIVELRRELEMRAREGAVRRQVAARPEDRAHRVAILELAREAHAEAGHDDAAAMLAWFVKLGRSQLAGDDRTGVGPAPERISMEEFIELVRQAGEIHRKHGRADSAAACALLADYYVERERAGAPENAANDDAATDDAATDNAAAANAEEHARRLLEADIEDRATRVAILQIARDAYFGASDSQAFEAMNWFAALGAIQLRGGDAADLPTPPRGVSMDFLTDLVRQAGTNYSAQGAPARAAACNALADFYVRRASGAGNRGETAADPMAEEPTVDVPVADEPRIDPRSRPRPVPRVETRPDPRSAPDAAARNRADLARRLRELRRQLAELEAELEGGR